MTSANISINFQQKYDHVTNNLRVQIWRIRQQVHVSPRVWGGGEVVNSSSTEMQLVNHLLLLHIRSSAADTFSLKNKKQHFLVILLLFFFRVISDLFPLLVWARPKEGRKSFIPISWARGGHLRSCAGVIMHGPTHTRLRPFVRRQRGRWSLRPNWLPPKEEEKQPTAELHYDFRPTTFSSELQYETTRITIWTISAVIWCVALVSAAWWRHGQCLAAHPVREEMSRHQSCRSWCKITAALPACVIIVH